MLPGSYKIRAPKKKESNHSSRIKYVDRNNETVFLRRTHSTAPQDFSSLFDIPKQIPPKVKASDSSRKLCALIFKIFKKNQSRVNRRREPRRMAPICCSVYLKKIIIFSEQNEQHLCNLFGISSSKHREICFVRIGRLSLSAVGIVSALPSSPSWPACPRRRDQIVQSYTFSSISPEALFILLFFFSF